jgi:hypothetical protein
MFTIKTKLEANGFWYLILSDHPILFNFQYFAMGSQGRFSSGELKGAASNDSAWQFCKSDFPILHLGVTSLEAIEDTQQSSEMRIDKAAYSGQHGAADFSRRKMIMATAATLLFGLLGIKSFAGNAFSSGGDQSAGFDPYSNSYSPYHSPYSFYSPYHEKE